MTDRTNDIATLITQLRILGQLTRAEAQVARLRVVQASSEAVRAELRQNATDADGRAARIDGALRDLGALTNPVTPLFGRVAALVKGALEQAQPLDEAVLGDLALEHQLLDRARYVAALADGTGRPEVRALAEHLVAAHTETVQWLTEVLTDLGTGRQAALGASPLQRVAAQVTHVANAPTRPALDSVGAGVAQAVQKVTKVAGAARDTTSDALDKAGDAASGLAQGAAQGATTAAGAVRDTAAKAVDKAGDAASGLAQGAAQGATTAAGAVRDTAAKAVDTVTEATGTAVAGAASGAAAAADIVRDSTAQTLDRAADAAQEAAATAADTVESTAEAAAEPAHDAPPAAPPIEGFADLPTHVAVAALRALDDPRDVSAMLEFEEAHGNRPAVVAAARLRLAALRTG